MKTLLPQAALVAGLFGALGIGLMNRPNAAALRVLAVASIIAALASLGFVAVGSGFAPIFHVDLKTIAWQGVIYAAALPLALWHDGQDDVLTALFLGAILGMGLLSAASNLPMLFMALEFMSLPAYLLVARSRPGSRGLEAALKYFFAGGLAGALFLMGLSLYYFGTGSLAGAAFLPPAAQAGAALMAVAALFKLGAVPLHWWLPDVYEGAAPDVAGFLSTAMKSAAVLFLMRLCELLPQARMIESLPAIGAATALVGSILALRQSNLQRLLAHSSIAHAGLLILGVGVWALSGRSVSGAWTVLFYLSAYAFMSNGTFAFLKVTGFETRDQLRGQGARMPLLAGAFTLLLLSLAGIPPTGGFFAKLLILWRTLEGGHVWPALTAAIAALISLAYYLGLTRDMWFEESASQAPAASNGVSLVVACAAGALVLGAAPWLLSGFLGAMK